jgi:hypothetical protein
MYEEPEEAPIERSIDPASRAKDKSDEFRMFAEFAACFEGARKFDASIVVDLDMEVARDLQRSLMKLERGRMGETPVISPEGVDEAKRLLTLSLSTNDYHIHRRPGEVMMVRWLEGEQAEQFYERMQAHFDAALNHYREEERQSQEWKQDEQTLSYLDALDAIRIDMAERYLREPIRTHKLFVLSTQAADELDILHLCDYVMGVEAAEVVGTASAPPENPSESDRAWYFKLFALRGVVDEIERMCFFTYLQKTGDDL